MRSNLVKVVFIVVLLVLAVVLAGMLMTKFRGNSTATSTTQSSMPSQESSGGRTLPNFLTPAEVSVLNTPTASSSGEDRKKHFDIAIRLARIADTLIIKECFSTPTVIQVKNNQMLKIENTDDVKHVLSFDKERRYELAPKSTKEVKISLPKDGLYGYACDYYNKATGLMLVTDK